METEGEEKLVFFIKTKRDKSQKKVLHKRLCQASKVILPRPAHPKTSHTSLELVLPGLFKR